MSDRLTLSPRTCGLCRRKLRFAEHSVLRRIANVSGSDNGGGDGPDADALVDEVLAVGRQLAG